MAPVHFVNTMKKLLSLLLLVTASTGVSMEKICVRSGEMVVLTCVKDSGAVTWRSPESSTEQSLLHDERLVILTASTVQQGNYSCSHGKLNKTFELTVYTTLSSECENKTLYSQECSSQQSCTLNCPTSNTPPKKNNTVTWIKGGKILSKDYFPSVKESDRGLYTCIRSYVYHGQIYNMTFTVKLVVKPKKTMKMEGIVSPRPDEVFLVDVGAPLVINCTAVLFSDMDEVFWQIKDTSIDTNDNLRVYSAYSKETTAEEIKMTASLIFKKISKDDLTCRLTCKLESMSQAPTNVSITLSEKVRTSSVGVTVSTVVITVVMVTVAIIYVKFKIHITLFIRDTLQCRTRVSDGKIFDACVMYYTSETGEGLSEDDRKTLENTLEDCFGYSLCLFDRDVLPGKAVADAVLECVEQSRAVLLVPVYSTLGTESALLSAVHEALVERQTQLVLIKNKSTEKTGEDSLSKTLQLLTDMGHSVTWKGSLDQSSFFWKQLRYYLPPQPQGQKISLLPQTVYI